MKCCAQRFSLQTEPDAMLVWCEKKRLKAYMPKLRKTKVLINKTKQEADVEKEALQAAVRNHNQ